MHSSPTKYSLGKSKPNLRSTPPNFCLPFSNLPRSGMLSGAYVKASQVNRCCHHNTKVTHCLAELGQ